MLNYQKIYISKGMTYHKYRALIDEKLANGKTTGADDSEEMLHYTKMNVQRMRRVDKTTTLTRELSSVISGLKSNYKFLVVTEGWCGDASQIVPVLDKVAVASAGKIDLKFVLRDENLLLIDAYLTNGGRAIPIVLVLNDTAETVLTSWGPRPEILRKLVNEWKNEGIEMPELGERLHAWYAKDKTKSIQEEMCAVFKQLDD